MRRERTLPFPSSSNLSSFLGETSRGLAYGKSVQTAFDLGLNELQLMTSASTNCSSLMDDAGVPVLLTREGVDALTVTLL